MRSGGVEIVHVESAKFVERPEEMLSAMDESGGGERETFLTGKSEEVMVKERYSAAELDILLISL